MVWERIMENPSVDWWKSKPLRGTHRLCPPLCHLQVLRVRKCKIRAGKLPKKSPNVQPIYGNLCPCSAWCRSWFQRPLCPPNTPTTTVLGTFDGWRFSSRVWLLLCGQLFFHTAILWKKVLLQYKIRKMGEIFKNITLEGLIPSCSDPEASTSWLMEGRRKGNCSSIPWPWTQAPQFPTRPPQAGQNDFLRLKPLCWA